MVITPSDKTSVYDTVETKKCTQTNINNNLGLHVKNIGHFASEQGELDSCLNEFPVTVWQPCYSKSSRREDDGGDNDGNSNKKKKLNQRKLRIFEPEKPTGYSNHRSNI